MMRRLIVIATLAIVTGCSTSGTMTSGEGGRDARSIERPAAYRSPEWTREHCADCGGRGPTHAGQERPRR